MIDLKLDENGNLSIENGDLVLISGDEEIAQATRTALKMWKEDWFLGAITDENARTTEIKLEFLTPGKKYQAIVYQDGSDADWEKNPKSYVIKTIQVNSKSKIKLHLAKGGGTAISFKPIN